MTTTYSPGVQALAQQIGLDPHHVAEALRLAHRSFNHLQATAEMSLAQFRSLFANNRHSVAIVANLAMRHAGRNEDALVLMDIYKASVGISPYLPPLRTGVGAHPDHAHNPCVQHAIRILHAASLPPIHTDGTRELRPGYQVLPDETGQMPGWLFLAPDPDAKARTGFTGGDLGYLAVMRWAGWGVITEPLPGGLYAICHPDHLTDAFPYFPAS